MNQMLLNCGMLPAIITDHSKYRQAFRIYDRNKDLTMMVYVLAKGILESYRVLSEIRDKYLEGEKDAWRYTREKD